MESQKYCRKYCRTYHLTFSPNKSDDDKTLDTDDDFINQDIIITEKLDGSNTCLEKDNCFARTHSGPPSHPSFDAFKALHSSIKHLIPDNIQIFTEWLYAKHSIHYTNLSSYAYIIGVRDNQTNMWSSFEELFLWSLELNIPTAPLLFSGIIKTKKEFIEIVNSLAKEKSLFGNDREGVVVRHANQFHDDEFKFKVGKFVRKNHVTSSEHWAHQQIIKNIVIS